MPSLPADRAKLALAQGNQVPSAVIASAKNINAITEVYDTVDLLNSTYNTHVGAATLAHPDGSVTTSKVADAAITEPKYATGSVSARAVADGVLTAAKFVAGALTNDTQNGLNITALQADNTQREINIRTPPYNCDNTGVSDSTTAIQNAINAVNTAGGGIVFFPEGTYKVTSALTLYVGVSLRGVNFSKSTIHYTGTGYCFTWPVGSNFMWGYIQDLGFQGTASATAAIMLEATHEGHINRCNFSGFAGGGIEFHESWSTKVTDCRFSGMAWGVKMNSNANALYFKGNQFYGQSQACALVGGGSGISFDMCNFENAGAGVQFISGSGWLNGLTIRDCYTEGCTHGALYVTNMSASDRIFGLLLESVYVTGLNSSLYAVDIDTGVAGGSVRGTVIELQAFDCTTAAVRAANAARIHCEQVHHWDYNTSAEKTLFSTDSTDVTSFSRGYQTLVLDKGTFVLKNLQLTNMGLPFPTASATYAGQFAYLAGGAGNADSVYMCLKAADNSYSWKQITFV